LVEDKPLELISIDTIIKEKLIPYGEETIRRYFRKGVLLAHDRKNGVTLLSYRGSVLVRYQSMLRLRAGRKRLTLNDLGDLFEKVSGPDDGFIVSKLKENHSISEIITEFLETARAQTS